MGIVASIREKARSPLLPNIALSYANTLVSMACNLAIIPLYLSTLGRSTYGFWVTVSGLVAYLGVLNLGIAQATSNLGAQLVAQAQFEQASRVVSTGVRMFARMASLAVVGAVLVLPFAPSERLFQDSGFDAYEIRKIVLLSAVVFLVELPLKTLGATLRAVGKVATDQAIGIGTSVSRLSFAAVYLSLTRNLEGLVLGFGLINLMASVGHWVALRRAYPKLHVRPSLFDPTLVPQLRQPGLYFLLLQIAGAVAFSTDALVLSSHLGTQAVSDYSVAQRLTTLTAALSTTFVGSFAPPLLAAYARREQSELVRLFRRARNACLLVGVAATLGLSLLGPFVIRQWVGSDHFVGGATYAPMVALAFIQIVLIPYDTLLISTSNHRLYAFAGVWEAVLNLSLSLVLVRTHGASGVALATVVARLLGAGPVLVLVAHRLLREPVQPAAAPGT